MNNMQNEITTNLRSAEDQNEFDLRNDVLKAVTIYNCSDSIWRYRDRIPNDVKLWFTKKYNTTLENINKIARDWVELPAGEYNSTLQIKKTT